MKKLYILNDGTTVVTENAIPGAKVGIKEVHEIDGLSDDEFLDLINNRPDFTAVKDKQGKLTELRRDKRRIVLPKEKRNI